MHVEGEGTYGLFSKSELGVIRCLLHLLTMHMGPYQFHFISKLPSLTFYSRLCHRRTMLVFLHSFSHTFISVSCQQYNHHLHSLCWFSIKKKSDFTNAATFTDIYSAGRSVLPPCRCWFSFILSVTNSDQFRVSNKTSYPLPVCADQFPPSFH